jgi:hypothetical protein
MIHSGFTIIADVRVHTGPVQDFERGDLFQYQKPKDVRMLKP